MKRVLALSLLLAGCAKSAPREIHVAAASSLRDLLEKSAPSFERGNPGTKLVFSFDASSTLARQIQEGAAFDVFISADPALALKISAATTCRVLGNRLVLVGRSDLASPPASPDALRGRGLKIAVCAPAVPAGKYAREYLGNKGLLAALEPDFVLADSVRAALALVAAGSADAGFVFVTDAKSAPSVTLLWSAPDSENPDIAYAAVVMGPGNVNVDSPADLYLRWLRGPEFQREAEALGFTPLFPK